LTSTTLRVDTDAVKTRPQKALDPMLGVHTRLVHGGEDGECSAVPIYQANTVRDTYSRFSNPTIEAFEAKYSQIERGEFTFAMATGMAAIAATLLAMARSGQHLLVHQSAFIGTDGLLGLLPRWGIRARRVDMRDMDSVVRELELAPALVYFEVLSNPDMQLLDAPEIIARARQFDIPVVVDNTLLSPIYFRPLEHGASVVLHSASKYIGGHGDALGGLISTSKPELAATIRDVRRLTGGTINPMNAFLLARSLPTLAYRMARHSANAQEIAEFWNVHPAVVRVDYPGLPSWYDHERAAKMLEGFGGVLSVELRSDLVPARVSSALQVCRDWYSFGDVATLIRPHDRSATKLRISAGLEDTDDLIHDLAQALDAASR
jgi:cystathionine beta-lyase/cystathionine gamma-synthase